MKWENFCLFLLVGLFMAIVWVSAQWVYDYYHNEPNHYYCYDLKDTATVNITSIEPLHSVEVILNGESTISVPILKGKWTVIEIKGQWEEE